MTSPPKNVLVTCPSCGSEYEAWYRPSVNLALEDFDEGYLEEAGTAICSNCGHKVQFDQLVVTQDWQFRWRAAAPDADADVEEEGTG